jgi:cytochrome c biogenesis protein CcmG/thiol:disulfide interchange protein DsbE
MPRRTIVVALLIAAVATGAFIAIVRGPLLVASQSAPSSSPAPHAGIDTPAPPIVGATLDGGTFDLAALKGKPVVINFWGPSCVPCRDEFPLLEQKLAQHAADGLVVVGVLTDDPPEAARAFVAQYGATWATVVDPDKVFKAAYRVAARPQSYFVDRNGLIRKIQIGELTDADFEREYALIAP